MLLSWVQATFLLRIVVGIGIAVCMGVSPQAATLFADEGKDPHGDPLPTGALMRLGTTQFRHSGSIYSLAYSADGRYLVTGNAGRRTLLDDASVVVWDAVTGQRVRSWSGHAHVVRSVAFSPDSKRVVVVNGYGTVHLYDLSSGKELWHPKTQSPEQAIFSPDGAVLLVSDTQNVRRWDAATGKELTTLRGHQSRIFSIAVSAKGKTMATWGSDGIVCLWDIDGRQRHRLVIPKEFGLGIALSADGKRLACGTADSDLRLVDTDTARELWRVKAEDLRITGQAFSPDGKTLVTGGNGKLFVWDAASGKMLRSIAGPPESMHHALFCPDGKRIASAGLEAAPRFWDPVTGKEIVHGEGHQHGVLGGAFSPDGKTLATVSDERFVRLWDLSTGKVRRFASEQAGIQSIAFTPDGKALLTAAPLYWPCLWDLSTGREVRRFTSKKQDYPGGKVHLSADGKTVAVGTGPLRIVLWDAATAQERPNTFQDVSSPLESPSWPPRCPHFVLSPDGKTVAVHRWGSVILWDLAARKGRLTLREEGEPAAFSPDGRLIAILNEQQVRLVDPATGMEWRRLKGDAGWVWCMAFSPDGKTVALAGVDGTVSLWETITAKKRHTFTGHEGPIRFVSFSPDGKRLASGGEDHTALIWDLSASSAKNRLTPKECDTLWGALGGADAAKAYRAIWAFAGDPERAVPYLRARLQPVVPVDRERLARLLRELDSERYAVRQQATHELEAMGEQALPALQQIQFGKTTLEFRRRVEGLLLNLRTQLPPPERLRQLRAIESLERAGTAGARRAIESLAQGAPEAHVTQDARAALDRLSHRGIP